MAASQLPARPSLEQYRKQSKDLLRRCKSRDPEALGRLKQHHPRLTDLSDAELHNTNFALADAQLVIAREHGFESWPKFTRHIEALRSESSRATVGLQEALIDVLLAHGARMDHPGVAGNAHSLVNGCLANGRAEAAEFLVSRGAPLDLEGAAGVGRLDIVRSFFNADGSLKPTATTAQMRDGFAWACEYGRTDVVEFLLDQGMDVRARLPRHGILHGQTALHWAALGGHVGTVNALLKRHAPVDAKDETFGTTPLSWALYMWAGLSLGVKGSDEPGAAPPGRYHHVVALLVAAGAKVEPDWLADEKIRADPTMLRALTGEMPEA